MRGAGPRRGASSRAALAGRGHRPAGSPDLLAVDGLAAVSMRVRPLIAAEAMAFMTARLRVRAGDRLAAERGEVADVERERLDATAVAARRSVAAGAGRIYFVDTILLLEAPDRTALSRAARDGPARGSEPRAWRSSVATLRIREAWAWLPARTRVRIDL